MNSKGLRDFSNLQDRAEYLEKKLKIDLSNIKQSVITQQQTEGRNIENMIGSTQIPLGVAGPIRIKNLESSSKEHYIPLTTTEGALVASVSRGCKATFTSGINVFIENVGITRGPVFKTSGLKKGFAAKQWIEDNFKSIAQECEATSSHLKLLKLDTQVLASNLFIRFYFDTSDAMGMNMATIATEKAVKLIEAKVGIKCVSLAGNFDIDKKSAALNLILGRGKRAWAEAVIRKGIVKTVLKTTPETLADLVYRKCQLGSYLAGSLGANAHFANIAAAIFAATGQDLAHVVEASLGVTTAEVLKNGDLYFAVYLPSLVVGTVGGGTHLPTQKEALAIMGLKDSSSVLEYSMILAAAILAGELSLLSSQAEGSLAKAHRKFGRKGAKSQA